MTPHDAGPFAALLAELGEVYGEEVSEARARLYFEALGGVTLAQVRRAVTGLVRSSRFFPRPVDIIEAVREAAERPKEWPALYAHPEQDDPQIKAMIRETIQRLAGGMTL